jgi:acyl-CoA thioester hydrolase
MSSTLRWQNQGVTTNPTLTPTRPQPEARSAYRAFHAINTRWADNDVYGHVNNVVYYSWFDTAVNHWLIAHGGLDIHAGSVIGLVVETHCNYFAPVAFPDAVVAGIRVAQLGTSSVRYEVGIFPADDSQPCVAKGHFIHVYVDRLTRRPAPLPLRLFKALETMT